MKLEKSLGAIFWFALVLAFFGFAFINAAHAADLPSANFESAPISKAVLVQDKSLTLTYAPEKIEPGVTQKYFADMSDLIRIEKESFVGDVSFKIQICKDYSALKEVCAVVTEKNATCPEIKLEPYLIYDCRDAPKSFSLSSGEKLQIIPDLSTAIYEKTESCPSPDGCFRVWEDLYVSNEKIEGATWWDGILLTKFEETFTGASNDAGSATYVNQTITASANYSLAKIQYKESSTHVGATSVYGILRNSAGAIVATSDTNSYAGAGAIKNLTFNASAVSINQANNPYKIQIIGNGVFGVTGLNTNPYAGGSAQRAEADWSTMDLWLQFWGVLPDTTAPILDACNPANGSNVAIGITQFRINATDETALAALNHTDTFTGTTAYNFTPYNGSAWYINVNFTTNGTYYWWASANDTASNSATTGNCSLVVLAPAVTTTTVAAGNATVTNVTISLPGFGWGVLFFIILVSFIVLGGLTKR